MKRFLLFVIGVILLSIIYFNVTFNFTILATFVLLLSLLLTFIYVPLSRVLNSKDKVIFHEDVRSFVSILVIAISVVGISKALNNYFFANVNVYSNSDHHAVKMNGAQIVDPRNFVVAGNHPDALLDKEKYTGVVLIKKLTDTTVVLELDGFTQSIYLEKYEGDELKGGNLINNSSLITVNSNDKVQFINGRDTCELIWHYYPNPDSPKSILCNYSYRYSYLDEQRNRVVKFDTMSENRVIKKGLDLNTILGEFDGANMSFDGVNLLRTTYQTAPLKEDEMSCLKTAPFVIELDKRAIENPKLDEIRVVDANGVANLYPLSTLATAKSEITIPIGIPFSVGCMPELKTSPVKFTRDSTSLYFQYVTPKYHNLHTLNKNGSNTIFMTTSLSQEIIENENPPKNIMLYDLFYNEDNGCNFAKPIYISFVNGPTTQEMSFMINHESTILAGEQFPQVKSKNGKLLWDIEVENFKGTNSHIDENNIILFIIVFGLCCMIALCFGRNAAGIFRYSTLIETLAFLATLLFFSFRLLLLWRASAFPPAEIATIYEFNHFFRSGEAILWQFVVMNIMFSVIITTKLFVEHGYSCSKAKGLPVIVDLIRLHVPLAVLTLAEFYLFDLGSIAYNWVLFVIPTVIYLVELVLWFFAYNDKLSAEEGGFANFFRTITQKCIDSRCYPKWRGKRIRIRLYLLWILLIFVLLGVVAFVGRYMPGAAVMRIMWPVSLYILNEILIWRYLPGQNNGIYCDDGEISSFSLRGIFYSGLGWSLMNGLTISAVLLVNDGGYGIIFFSFFLFVVIFKMYDFVKCYRKFENHKKKVICLSMIFGLGLIYAICLLFYKTFMTLMASWSLEGCAVVLAVIFTILLWLVSHFIWGMRPFRGKRILYTSLIIITVSCISSFLLKEFVFKDHTLQRVLVHIHTPEEGLSATNTSEEERRFFEASINDYILNIYNQNAADIDIIGGGGKSYFKVQPHSKVGALWGAQASDILPARFIISEHGKYLPWLFVAMYLVMLYAGIRMHTKYRVSKMLLIQIPALLLIHSLFVWLANTQMFIFLGQDFPLFSLHSKLAVLYYFILISIWVAISIIEKMEVVDRELKALKESDTIEHHYNGSIGRVYTFSLFIMLVLFAWIHSPQSGKTYRESDKLYSLEQLLEKTEKHIDTVNMLFTNFQSDTNIVYANLSDVSNVIFAFNAKYGDTIKDLLDGEESIHYRLWDRFVNKGGTKHNESSSLLHVRRKHGKLRLAVRTKFYDKRLPSRNRDSWMGSIVAYKEKNGAVALTQSNNYFTQYILPDYWVVGDESVVVLKRHAGVGNVTSADGRNPDFKFESGYSSAFCRFPQDLYNSDKNPPALAEETYFARNVMINGNRDFLYPMSNKFFWAYSFANEVLHQKNNQNDEFRKDPNFNADIPVTFDANLTSRIYDKIGEGLNQVRPEKSDSSYMSVIVADGDGLIRAMVDRKMAYDLNPNNRKLISEVSDALYMDYDAETNDAYFGNMNMLVMRDGPGSSQKPIVWTAVASGIDYNWEEFQMLKFSQTISGRQNNIGPEEYGIYYYTRLFNGERLYSDDRDRTKTFDALKSDENYGQGVGVRQYMKKSSNFYNAAMLYIGAFNSFDMTIARKNDNDPDAMFVKVDRNDIFTNSGYKKAEYDSLFPIFTYHQNSYQTLFKFNKQIPEDLHNSLLYKRLNGMFNFNSGEKISSIYPSLQLNTDAKKRLNNYAFVVNPTFEYNILTKGYRPEFLQNAVHFAAVGGGSPWQVSPLSMAQIFGQLTMLKSNYRMTIDPTVKKDKYIPYADLSQGYLNARNAFLLGMNDVFSSEGTARRIGAIRNQERMTIDGYYIYGKTGTANEHNTDNTGLHRLGVVITDRPIENLNTDELGKVKFYTVFFTARYNNYVSYYGEILKEIIASQSFKNYMSGANDR